VLLFLKKLTQKTVDVSATRYGRKYEESAILSYVNHQRAHGVMVSVQPCGMNVDESSPWLAASPDGIILDPTQSADSQKGCLELKCPNLCEKSLILDLSRINSTFCLKEKNGKMQLSSTHAYYYQIQTEMHVTRLPWCDFVVWSPKEDIFLERVYYDKAFMDDTMANAQAFYFKKYLPSIISCMIIAPTASSFIDLSMTKPAPSVATVKSAPLVISPVTTSIIIIIIIINK